MIDIAILVILAALIFAAFVDLKTREVPDWLSYGMIVAGVGIALIKSLVSSDFTFLLYSAIGLIFMAAIACLMYYTGQWGGGDAKTVMGIGALLGLNVSLSFPFISPEQTLVAFFINLLIVAVLWGLFYSAWLAFMNRKKFLKELKIQLNKLRIARYVLLLLSVLLVAAVFIISDIFTRIATASFAIITIFTFYVWIFVRAVENSCMYKMISPDKLVEGDWVAKDVTVKGKVVCKKTKLGIEKEQISKLVKLMRQGRLKKVLLRDGVPFVPSFFIAFIITLACGNLMFLLI